MMFIIRSVRKLIRVRSVPQDGSTVSASGYAETYRRVTVSHRWALFRRRGGVLIWVAPTWDILPAGTYRILDQGGDFSFISPLSIATL
jgi:hypothetical protein